MAVGALGGLTALGLGTAIGLTAADGSVYLPKSAEYPDDITWNFQAQYRAAYALTALTAAGLGAALINWRRLTGRAQENSPPARGFTGWKSFPQRAANGVKQGANVFAASYRVSSRENRLGD